ncbi:hypothetical protein JOB18_035909 [Solea senegalensis]|uniref:Uncharacterized protein n=1 Tax=Solea senegalensis TaxID=28829 RepID=A0AAV6RJL5_SOLSE|nr:hypothetical protein JOB18_035909 [Solea senegalensis]
MGPLWFTAQRMPVPWVYSPSSHIHGSIILSIPPLSLSLSDGSCLQWKSSKLPEKENRGRGTVDGGDARANESDGEKEVFHSGHTSIYAYILYICMNTGIHRSLTAGCLPLPFPPPLYMSRLNNSNDQFGVDIKCAFMSVQHHTLVNPNYTHTRTHVHTEHRLKHTHCSLDVNLLSLFCEGTPKRPESVTTICCDLHCLQIRKDAKHGRNG